MKRVQLFIIIIFLLVLLGGCTADRGILFFNGESNTWSANVTLHIKNNHLYTNTVIRPKDLLDINYLTYTTTFSDYIDKFHSSHEEKGEDIAFKESYGKGLESVFTTNYNISDLEKIEHATIKIKWGKDDKLNSEIITSVQETQ